MLCAGDNSMMRLSDGNLEHTLGMNGVAICVSQFLMMWNIRVKLGCSTYSTCCSY